jgi:hypothetical protein
MLLVMRRQYSLASRKPPNCSMVPSNVLSRRTRLGRHVCNPIWLCQFATLSRGGGTGARWGDAFVTSRPVLRHDMIGALERPWLGPAAMRRQLLTASFSNCPSRRRDL